MRPSPVSYTHLDVYKRQIYDDTEKLWWHSPVKYARACTTPTLFIHSDEDYRCPMAEGLQMYTALVDLGVESKLV